MFLNAFVISLLTKVKVASDHDHLNPLGDRIRFVAFFFSQDMGEVAQLPDWTTLTAFPGQLHTRTHTFIVRGKELTTPQLEQTNKISPKVT